MSIAATLLDKGYTCSACGSFCKRYTRTLNANMSLALICLARHSKGQYVKVEDLLLKQGYKRCGDFSYLRFYGLIEKKAGNREDGSSRNGYYRITGRGIMFAENKLKVPKQFMIYHNGCDGFKGEDVSILETLGKAFNYDELMNIQPTKLVERPAKYKSNNSQQQLPNLFNQNL